MTRRIRALVIPAGLALGCATRPAEPPAEPAPTISAQVDEPPSGATAAPCRQAYGLQLLAPDGSLFSEDLRGRAAEMVAAAKRCPPQSADEAANLAIAHMVRDEHDLGGRAAQQAVEFDPNSSFAYFARGLVASDLDDHGPAEADFRKAIELEPNRVEAHLELGLLLEAEGQVEEARRSLARASEIRPDYILGDYYLAMSYLEDGDVASAGPHCEATLKHSGDNDMYLCRGLARAERGDHRGAIEDLEGLHDNPIVERYDPERHAALRSAYLAVGDPVSAADHTCLDSYGLDEDDCDDQEIAKAVDRVRGQARQRATEGSFAAASRLSSAQFARELAKQAKQAKVLDDFIHPDIGVFVFYPYGWSMVRQTAWPDISEALRELDLTALSRVTRLRKTWGTEQDELDCGYPLDAVLAPGEPGALPTYYNSNAYRVEDSYRLGSPEWLGDSFGDDFDKAQLEAMQRAALAITHHVMYGRERYEFGKIGERWYLLSVSVEWDPEEDACG